MQDDIPILDPSNVGVLLIDAQPAFWDWAFEDDDAARESVMIRLEHLLMLADWLELPVIATFEHPVDQNGELPDRLEKVFPARGGRFTKRTYNCCLEPPIWEAIQALSVRQLALAGAETDVCILQSTLALLRAGYQVFLLEDCLFTSEPQPGPALRRMVAAGAVPATFKSFAYELTRSVEHTPWLDTWIGRGAEGAKTFPADFTELESFPEWQPKW
jgi:nicotinamidase-related amidase